MKFIKDVLLFDIETSGADLDRDVIVQFSAVLLDKDNLLEKAFYTSYVRNSLLQETLLAHAAAAKIDVVLLQNGVKPLDFLKALAEKFPGDITLAAPNASRVFFLRQAFKKQASAFPYSLTHFDLWTLQYVHSLRTGLRKIPTLHTLAEQYHLTLKNPYDAFERVRLYAVLLRKMLSEF